MRPSNIVLILGLVRWLQPVHGYDVHRELMSWGGQDQWGVLKPGAIYHGLKRLTARGLLEVASTERVDNRPARTSYRITAEGEAEFQQLLRSQLWELHTVVDPFFAAWSFLPVLSQREAAAMLRNRARLLRDRITEIESFTGKPDNPRSADFLPRHIGASMRLAVDHLALNERWCLDTADSIEAGELYAEADADLSPEKVARWKAHIATLDSAGRRTASNDSDERQ